MEGAAFQSRLPFDKLSSLEAECFSDLQGSSALAFIQIRNRVLKLWFEDPKKQLTQELAIKKMEVSDHLIIIGNIFLQFSLDNIEFFSV